MERHIDPDEEPHRKFIESLTDKEYQTMQIAKELQSGLFHLTATNIYIEWNKKNQQQQPPNPQAK